MNSNRAKYDFEVRLTPGWDRNNVIINPSKQQVENVFRDQSVGRTCLGELCAGCFKIRDGKNSLRDCITLDFYLDGEGLAVISRDYNLFKYLPDANLGRKLLPMEGGETSLIETRFFVPVTDAIDTVHELATNGPLADFGEYWDDPLIHDNIVFD